MLLESFPQTQACTANVRIAQTLPGHEAEIGLDQLIKRLAQANLDKRTFKETYYSHMLTTPSKKEGILIFQPPDRLEKHIRIPMEESFIANGNTLLYENPSREISHTLSLQEYPALSTLINGLRALFNGDPEQLQQVFSTSISGSPESWVLDLSPKISNDEEGVDCIRLTGEWNDLRTLEIHETNGDRSILSLDPQTP